MRDPSHISLMRGASHIWPIAWRQKHLGAVLGRSRREPGCSCSRLFALVRAAVAAAAGRACLRARGRELCLLEAMSPPRPSLRRGGSRRGPGLMPPFQPHIRGAGPRRRRGASEKGTSPCSRGRRGVLFARSCSRAPPRARRSACAWRCVPGGHVSGSHVSPEPCLGKQKRAGPRRIPPYA